MEHGSLFLMEPDGQQLRLVDYRQDSDFYLEHFSRGVKVGEQLTGTIAKTGEVLFTNTIENDPRVNPELRANLKTASFLGIPLTSRGQIVGVLNLTSNESKDFSDNDLALYKAIGSQVGIAVENAQLYSQAQQLAALEERNRLARDLHDSVTQTLFSITLTAESARAMLVKKPERVESQLDRLQTLARGALAEMPALIFQLRPAALEEQGLTMALQKHIDSVKSKEGLDISFTVDGDKRLSNEQEQALYRISQEALNNIVKHAQATHVEVKLTIGDSTAVLTIYDNGVGFEPLAVASRPSREHKSLGMTSMRERAELAGGQFEINSTPGQGTVISITLPLMAAPRPVGIGIN
jgi:signal transduction histidine kinase